MERIKLSKDEKKSLDGLVERRKVARAAFIEASQMIHDTERVLWKKIKELWSDAHYLEYPTEGDWFVVIDKKEDA